MIEIYVSNCVFNSRSVETVLRLCGEAGIRRLELGGGLDPAPDLLVLLQANRPSLRYLVHNYFPPPREPLVINLASASAENRERSLAFCRRSIDLACTVGSDVYSVHAGFCADLSVDELGGAHVRALPIPRADARQNFFASLMELQHYASAAGVSLCVENNVIEPDNVLNGGNALTLLTSAADFEDFAREPALADIGLLLDVGHLKVSASSLGFDPRDAIEAIADRLEMLHLSDNDGTRDANACFDRCAWFWPHLKNCRRPSSVTIEVRDLNPMSLRALLDLTAGQLATIWA